ncbi:MAG: SH3 domain-containing protein [Devosia sp.]|nr:SH3 domain-containing protein [Devosia sp.]
MALSRKLLASGLATLAVLATTAAASAAPAFATSNVNVRSGPGTGYAIVDALRRGERVDVQYCRGSWCYVDRRGPSGWVSASYLDSNRWDDGWNRPAPPPPPVWNNPRPPHWNPGPGPRPPVVFPPYPSRPGASFCFNGPNGYFCAGS